MKKVKEYIDIPIKFGHGSNIDIPYEVKGKEDTVLDFKKTIKEFFIQMCLDKIKEIKNNTPISKSKVDYLVFLNKKLLKYKNINTEDYLISAMGKEMVNSMKITSLVDIASKIACLYVLLN